VPAHKLLQHTFVETREGIRKRHLDHLKHQHMRYMWIPHTDTVVVVTCDPIDESHAAAGKLPPGPTTSETEASQPLRDLLLSASRAAAQGKLAAGGGGKGGGKGGAPSEGVRVYTAADASRMNFAQLRDALLALAPLNREHVVAVNRAEAAYWKNAQGWRIDWSDKILGFECGGQQWVSEVAMPCGTLSTPDLRDLAYMDDLLHVIEHESDLPTPAPIEQRWTRRSRARMSPAHSLGDDDLHTWVGIIMYLPTQEEAERAAITKRFWEYNALCRERLWPKYGCHQHWAKIELPETPKQLASMRARLGERFPLDELREAKRKLDPKGVLGNTLIDTLLRE